MNKLTLLADMLKQRQLIDHQITTLINRPAQVGHVGEFIAAAIFDIELEMAANNKAYDGRFKSGSLSGASVNVKWYTRDENLLDISVGADLDFYLVLAGPKKMAGSPLGVGRPWVIESVYLIDAPYLIRSLVAAGKKIGIATSVRQKYWCEAKIFPEQH
ncbi:MAG TPA: hypothetical protein VNE17_06410, partial [Nitrolancea sp.]|nr:hypothetical protein [Nitrolancea sp.]